MWQTFYNHTFWNLTVTVRGRHPSLYRQPALSHVYRRSSHAANFLEYIRSGLERLRIAKSSIFRFRYIRRHLSVGAFKCRSLPWGDTTWCTQHPREGKSIQSEANVYFWLYSLTRDFLRVLIGLERGQKPGANRVKGRQFSRTIFLVVFPNETKMYTAIFRSV